MDMGRYFICWMTVFLLFTIIEQDAVMGQPAGNLNCGQFTPKAIDLWALTLPAKKKVLTSLLACVEAHRNVYIDGVYFKHGMTGLMGASLFGFNDIVSSFHHLHANVNARDDDGNTPAIHAARWGHEEILRFLLDSGAHMDWQNSGGFTAIHEATKNGQLETVKVLTERGADPNLVKLPNKTTLMMAAERGSDSIVKALLMGGADISPQDSNRWTAITFASQYRHLSAVGMLQSSKGHS